MNQPDRHAYTFLEDGQREESTLTYCELDRRARAIAVALRELGISEGRALLLYPSGLEFLAGFFGCLYAGVVAVPAYPPDPSRASRTLPRLRAIAADAKPVVALTDSLVFESAKPFLAEAPDLNRICWLQTDSLGEAAADLWMEPKASREGLAFLQYTSGSTGTPRGVKLTHANLLHNAAMVYAAFEHTEDDVYVSWLPTFHDMGFMAGVLQPLYAGVPAIEMSPVAFLQKPLKWLAAISRYKATISGGPNFAYDLCVRRITDDEKSSIDLSSWSVAFNGAEPVRAETVDRFTSAFQPCGFQRKAFYPCYGLAEATLIVTGGRRNEAPIVTTRSAVDYTAGPPPDGTRTDRKSVVGCGPSLLDQRVAIVDPETLIECESGETGEIWIRGPSVAHGYWNRSENTKEVFEAYIAATGEGPFLRTGDLGFLEGCELFVTGRLKDLIIIRGVNHYPQDIELTVEGCHSALRPGCGAAFSIETFGEERLAVVQEIDNAQGQNLDSVIANIREALASKHELQVCAISLLRPGGALKTSSGKIRRRECRDAFLGGELPTVAEWRALSHELEQPIAIPWTNPQAIASWLGDLVGARLGIGKQNIEPSKSVVQHGIDSLNAIELSHHIEDEAGITLRAGELLRSSSIEELAARVFELVNNGADRRPPFDARSKPLPEYHLSHGQRGLWFLQKLEPHSPLYNIAWAVRIRSGLDVEALHAGLQAIVERHRCLRTTFVPGPDGPLQRVHDSSQISFSLEESDGWSDESIRERFVAEAQLPFDLERGPLLRVLLFKRPSGEYALLLCAHHLILDFRSLSLIVEELSNLYEAEVRGIEASLPHLSLEYCDHVVREVELLSGAEGEKLWRYWRDLLTEAPPALNLPTDRAKPRSRTFNGASLFFRVDRDSAAKISALGRNYGATRYVTLLAAFQALLYRYTGQKQIVVGSPVAGRAVRDFELVAGYFVNMVPLCSHLSDDLMFASLLTHVQRMSAEALDHQEFPFSLMVDRLQIARDLSRSPIFQVAFTFQQSELAGGRAMSLFAVGDPDVRMTLGGLELESISLERRTAEYEITLSMAEAEYGLAGSFEYNTDLFDRATIERMAGHFQRLLESVAARPETAVSRASLLRPTEVGSLLLHSPSPTGSEPTPRKTLVELFEEQAEARGDAVAATFEDEELTYGELNRRANKVARYLRRLGALPETYVGICVDRSMEMVVGLLGIVKSGAAYVPVDASYPRERVSFILEDSGVEVLVTEEGLVGGLGEGGGRRVCIDREWDQIEEESWENVEAVVEPENAAYVIYTSGSTGRPKGVVVSHRNVGRLFEATKEKMEFTEEDVWSLFHSCAFDFSVWELWGALMYGGRVVVVPYWVSRNPEAYRELVEREGVTIVNQTPTAMRQFIEAEERRKGERVGVVRAVILGGEELEVTSLRRWIEEHGDEKPQIINMYGITETTVHVSYRRIRREDVEGGEGSPIGKAIEDLQIYVLDGELEAEPISVVGEMWVGGEGVARCYLNEGGLTAERFRPDPWSERGGERMYGSGDLGRMRRDREIEYVGRKDDQVKIRGFRIEVGEVEAALNRHAGVGQSAVVAQEGRGGEKRLVAYVKVRGEEHLSMEELRGYLKEKLPEYMVPAAIVEVEGIPLTEHGKLDRKALPEVDWSRREGKGAYEAPSNEVERGLAEVWSSVLGVEQVGIRDNFFDLGGDSILSIQAASKAREIGLELSPKQIFEHQQIEELARFARPLPDLGRSRSIERELWFLDEASLERLESEHGAVKDVFPLSWTQQGILFHCLSDAGSGVYITQIVFELRGLMDDQAFEGAWQKVVDKDEVLRAEFEWDGLREPLHVIKAGVQLKVQQLDWRQLEREQQQSRLAEFLSEDRLEGFNLKRAPLMRVATLRVDDEVRWCVWSSHHLLIDGWSAAIALREVFDLYDGERTGRPPSSGGSPSFSEFISWLRRQDQSTAEKFWRETLKGFAAPTSLGLMGATATRQRASGLSPGQDAGVNGGPANQVDLYREESLHLSEELTSSLQSLARSHRVSLSSVIQAAWSIALSRYSGDGDILFGVTLSGRPPELEAVERRIGLFITTLPLRVRVRPRQRAIELLAEIQKRSVELQEHQYSPLAKIREWSEIPGDTGLFESILVFENYPVAASLAYRQQHPEIRSVRSIEQTNYPLTIAAIPGPELALEIGYQTHRFDTETVRRVLKHLRTLLEEFVRAPECRISDLEMVSAAESLQISEWNRGLERRFDDLCLHELFERSAALTPDAVALIFEGESISYRRLDHRSKQIAQLIGASGAGRGNCVAVCLDRSPDLIAAVLGVLKLGCVYLPIDPHLPAERINLMLDDADAKLIIADEPVSDLLSTMARPVVRLEHTTNGDETPQSRLPRVFTSEIAYVIYTSGSTGKPKGVVVSHAAVSNHMQWMAGEFPLSASDRGLQTYSIGFDAAIAAIFYPLACGAALVIPPPDGEYDIRRLIEIISEQQVTTIDTVPTMLNSLLDEERISGCKSLHRIICGGELLPAALPRRLFSRLSGVHLVNVYGPTEATISATSYCIQSNFDEFIVPIGRPIENASVFIVDEDFRRQPIGVTGEIRIGGAGLAEGYLNRPDLSADRFVPHPFSEVAGERLYRTGDLGLYQPDGSIRYAGRCDDQIKIRGFRIEPLEIESILNRHPGIKNSAVAAREDRSGQTRLVAYLVPRRDGPSVSEIRDYLRQELPHYMTPARFVLAAELPLTPGGKVNRRALQHIDFDEQESEREYETPRDEIESELARIWEDALGVARAGVRDNFFELGGDSILSIQIVARAREAGFEISPKQVFDHPTIAELAAVARRGVKISTEHRATGLLPLTPIQRWFFEQGVPLHHHNQAVMLEVTGELDASSLEKALAPLIEYHDSLRLRFERKGQGWRQHYAGRENNSILWRIDLSHLARAAQTSEMQRIADEAQASLDIETGPMFRAVWFSLEESLAPRLLLIAHHLVVDLVSWRIIIGDLDRICKQLRRGQEVRLPHKTLSYGRWAEILIERAGAAEVRDELAFWTSVLSQDIRPLPVDHQDGENTISSMRTMFVALSADDTRRLLGEAARLGRARIDEVLLTALARAFSSWTEDGRLLVDVEGHGRDPMFEELDLSSTVGWFTTIFPVLIQPAHTEDPAEALASVRKEIGRIPAKGAGYGLLRYLSDNANVRRAIEALPGAEVSFNYLGRIDSALHGSSLFALVSEYPGETRDPRGKRSHLIEIEALVTAGRLEVGWSYSKGVHDRRTIRALVETFSHDLARLFCLSDHAEIIEPALPHSISATRVPEPNEATDSRAIPESVYPLSPMQHGLLFHSLYEPQSDFYCTQLVCRLMGDLNRGEFQSAWQVVFDRHGAIRSCFEWEGVDEPVQVVKSGLALKLDHRDWRGFEDREQREMLEQYLGADRRKGFDVRRAPLVRLALIRTGENAYEFVLSSHHLLIDGWSLSILLSDFFSAYEALCAGEAVSLPERRPYGDYIGWLEKLEVDRGRGFWRALLEGFSEPTPLALPPRSEESRRDASYHYQELWLTIETSLAMRSFVRAHKLTLNTLGQGLWGLLLSIYSGRDDVVFGAVTSGRSADLQGIESMVGLFINTLPVRLRVQPDADLVEWLSQLQSQHAEIREYESCALSRVQSWSDVPAGTPLFESLFVFQNYPLHGMEPGSGMLQIGGVSIENVRSVESSNYPLTIWLIPGDRPLVRLGYDRERFEEETIEQLLEGFLMLLETALASPELRLGDLVQLPAVIRCPSTSRDRTESAAEIQIGVGPRSAVEKVIARLWRQLLRLERVSLQDNFFDSGGQPVLATRLLQMLRESLRVEIPLADFLKTPTVESLAKLVVEHAPVPSVVDRIAAILNEIEEMPEEELKRAIEAKEKQAGGHGKEKHFAGQN